MAQRLIQIKRRGYSEIIAEALIEVAEGAGAISAAPYYMNEIPITPVTLVKIKRNLRDRVNHAAGLVRAESIPIGSGMDTVLMLKHEEAVNYIANGGPLAGYPLLQAEATALGRVGTFTANQVISQMDAFKTDMAAIEVIRRTAEIFIRDTEDRQDAIAASNQAVEDLQALI